MLPSNGGDVGMVEEEDEVQIVEEGARQQVGPYGMRTPGENLRILLAQKKAGKSSWWWLRLEGLPSSVWDIAAALTERKQQQNGQVQLQLAEHRRLFWGHHMSPTFPHVSRAAVRLLSAHVTSAASERNWSVVGNIFTKTRNKLALERAKKLVTS